MDTLRFQIFQKHEDYLDWQKYEEYIKNCPEFDDTKKQILTENYRLLKKELGKDYLERKSSASNQIRDWLWNMGHHYSQLVWLCDSLRYFKSTDSNYDRLLGKLKTDESCKLEGLPFLWAGDSLRKVGFEVTFPSEKENQGNPDILIRNPLNDDMVYAEISKLDNSEERSEISDTYHQIMNVFTLIPPIIPFGGKINRNINDDEKNSVLELLISKKKKTFESEDICEISMEETNNLLHAMIAHPSRRSELEEWVNKNKYRSIENSLGNTSSLPLNFDETIRITRKIGRKMKQMPAGLPCIIYLPIEPLYFLWGIHDFEHSVETIRDTLIKYPNLIGVCLYSHLITEVKPYGFIEIDFFERKLVHGNIEQTVWFLLNPGCKTKLTPDTILRLYNSFSMIYAS